MCTGLWRELDLHFKTLKNCHVWNTIGRWSRQKVHETVARARLHKKKHKNLARSEKRGTVPIVSAARTLVDVVRRSCFAGVQQAVTKPSGTAARSKAFSDAALRCSWQAGLQLEVAQRIVTAARKEVLGHSATLVLCHAGLQLQVAKCILTAARREELGCRSWRRASWEAAQSRVREEVAQIRGCSEKLLRQEGPRRRGCSMKKYLRKEVTHSSIHSLVQPAIHWLINSLYNLLVDSLIHWLIGSLLIDWFIDSLFHWLIDSSTHYFTHSLFSWFIESLIHCAIDSQIHSLVDPLIGASSTRSFIHWFTASLIREIFNSLIHCFTDSLIHWIIDSLVRFFFPSLIYWIIDSLISALNWFTQNHWFTQSLIHWFIGWIRSVLHGFFHVTSFASQPPFAHSLMRLTTSTIRCCCIVKTFL